MNAAVIVAHPDDEIIWCGGLILQHPEWDWSVLSLSRQDDPDRCPKFHRVCNLLNLQGYISDLDDGDPPKTIDRRREIGSRIMEHLSCTPWNLCITHGDNGEYGHPRHKEVHKEVLDLVRDGILECDELLTFAYECDSKGRICRVNPRAETIVDLSESHLLEKRRIVRDMYGYGRDSFEVRACISPEAFQERQFQKEVQLP